MKYVNEQYQIVVCGGGLAGFCAAVAAARHGAKTCLIHDRPVFGGNSSSEVRVTPHGAANFHAYARETGIISELLAEERARNHEPIAENGWTNSVWDMVLYDLAANTPNLAFHLNTAVEQVVMATPRKIEAVVARTANAEVELTAEADLFVDCTGDGIVADLAGCAWRMGSEGRDEFDEPHAPPQTSDDVMGSSLLFKAKDMGHPAPFTPPPWAARYTDVSFFYEQGRVPDQVRCGYWWIEIGVPWHTIHDNEDIRHELTRHVLGVWNWIKNKDPNLKDEAANYALDWVGQVPGKRESRRIVGRYLMTEHDPLNNTLFPDEVAFGGWFIDIHTPGGLLAETSEPNAAEGWDPTTEQAVRSYVGPYGIPLRCLIARDVDNLLMAGRDVSVTHAALGTVRVMGTTALMGQAAGTAAAVAFQQGIPIHQVPERAITRVQQALLRDGCFLPSARNEEPHDLARSATATASSEALCHGVGPESSRPHGGLRAVEEAVGLERRADTDLLDRRRGQWIAVATDHVACISACLSNPTEQTQTVEAELLPVEHIWDYRVQTGKALAHTTLRVPPGRLQWVEWPVDVDLEPGRYVRLDLLANPNIQWHTAGAIEPGHPSAFQIGPDKMRRYGWGIPVSFRISPPQPCYSAGNTVTGVARPHRWTNLWRSDPAASLEQWLQLEWPTEQTIAQILLTFPGHLFTEYHHYPPFYRAPQCLKDYTVAAWAEGDWRPVVQVTDNYQRYRAHTLERPVKTRELRVTVHATNGDPSAAIYEVRCYGPS
jgi:hypothetical protein